jgi:hypothetical protein
MAIERMPSSDFESRTRRTFLYEIHVPPAKRLKLRATDRGENERQERRTRLVVVEGSVDAATSTGSRIRHLRRGTFSISERSRRRNGSIPAARPVDIRHRSRPTPTGAGRSPEIVAVVDAAFAALA